MVERGTLKFYLLNCVYPHFYFSLLKKLMIYLLVLRFENQERCQWKVFLLLPYPHTRGSFQIFFICVYTSQIHYFVPFFRKGHTLLYTVLPPLFSLTVYAGRISARVHSFLDTAAQQLGRCRHKCQSFTLEHLKSTMCEQGYLQDALLEVQLLGQREQAYHFRLQRTASSVFHCIPFYTT